jgi:hypothetical protein
LADHSSPKRVVKEWSALVFRLRADFCYHGESTAAIVDPAAAVVGWSAVMFRRKT